MVFSLPTSTKVVAVTIDYDSALVRLIFRSYLLVVTVLFSYVGGKCCEDRAKLQLMKGKGVKLTQMTGWLSGYPLLSVMKELQTFPAGALGSIMMIIATILGLTSDLAITTLIQSRVVTSRCQFGTGLVVTLTPENITQVPPTNAAPYFVVTQAQITSQANGGLKGIYGKANRSFNFTADPTDIIGEWTCRLNSTQLLYPFDYEPDVIISDVQQHGLLYGPEPPWCSADYGPEGWAHLVIWDSSVADLAQSAFEVRASIDMTGEGSDSKVMQSYECHINTSELDSILSTILSKTTLSHWCASLQSLVYNGRFTPASNNTESLIEEVLNSMVMVAGGNNYLLNTTASDETQGCLVVRTDIHLAVVILTSTITAIAIASLIYWAVLVVLKRQYKKKNQGARKQYIKNVEKITPKDILDWMALTVRISQGKEIDVEAKKLKKWVFQPKEDGIGLEICKDQVDEQERLFVPPPADHSAEHELDELDESGGPGQAAGVEPPRSYRSSLYEQDEQGRANVEEAITSPG